MRVVALKTLREFYEKHPDAEQPIRAWYKEALHASWSSPNEIKARFPGASIVKGNRIVFTKISIASSFSLQCVE